MLSLTQLMLVARDALAFTTTGPRRAAVLLGLCLTLVGSMAWAEQMTPAKEQERPNVRFPDGQVMSDSIRDPKQRLASFDFTFSGPFFPETAS